MDVSIPYALIRSPFADRVALTLGPLTIHWYGIIIALGVLVGMALAAREARRRKLNAQVLYDMLLWIGIAAILGARAYYVIFNWAAYRASPFEIIAIWHGGLAIHGMLIGGLLGYLLYARSHKLSHRWAYLDCIVLGVLAGQIIGRLGNFANEEAFGTPTDLPWGLYISPEHRPAMYRSFDTFHPTFLYEMLWNLAVLAILWTLNTKRRLKSGQTVALYMVGYGVGRFLIEMLRTDSIMVSDVRLAQLTSLVLIVAGIVVFQHLGVRESWLVRLFSRARK